MGRILISWLLGAVIAASATSSGAATGQKRFPLDQRWRGELLRIPLQLKRPRDNMRILMRNEPRKLYRDNNELWISNNHRLYLNAVNMQPRLIAELGRPESKQRYRISIIDLDSGRRTSKMFAVGKDYQRRKRSAKVADIAKDLFPVAVDSVRWSATKMEVAFHPVREGRFAFLAETVEHQQQHWLHVEKSPRYRVEGNVLDPWFVDYNKDTLSAYDESGLNDASAFPIPIPVHFGDEIQVLTRPTAATDIAWRVLECHHMKTKPGVNSAYYAEKLADEIQDFEPRTLFHLVEQKRLFDGRWHLLFRVVNTAPEGMYYMKVNPFPTEAIDQGFEINERHYSDHELPYLAHQIRLWSLFSHNRRKPKVANTMQITTKRGSDE